MAEALARVAGDDALRADLRARGLRRASTFTWARTVDGLEALWRAAADA
jgi:glycosyltransferase involved in cell wall biosynthesis